MGEEMNMYPPLEGNVMLYPDQRLDNDRTTHLADSEGLKNDMEMVIIYHSIYAVDWYR